ncbi:MULTISPECIES: hypothetical protein [unclassified Rathayibacter]|uniref:hypothetical protein n=1 Tax=unclassified Rathayibacter TaxID=2609250 RepID=UPI001C2098BE|nr:MULTISPECIES: hypothetical protein [unclassified Rathayibacter]
MTAFLSQDGPFADSTDENRLGEQLPYEPPIEGLLEPDLQPPLYTERLAVDTDEAAAMDR